MYTDGIRKILIIDNKMYGHIDKLFEIAEKTGHLAALHNGQVWCKTSENGWLLSPFTLDDFTT